MIPNTFTLSLLNEIRSSIHLHSKTSLAKVFDVSPTSLTKHLVWLSQSGKITISKLPLSGGFGYILKPVYNRKEVIL